MPFLCKICEANVGTKLSTAQQQETSAPVAVPCTSATDDKPTAAAPTIGRCSFCLGLLDDDELHQKIVEEAIRQLRREGHEAVNFVLALNMPMSVLLREAVVERLVEPAWSPMSMSPKELLSRQLMPKISKTTGLRPSLNSDLIITVTLENDEFVQTDFNFVILHFTDEFMRASAPKRRRRGGGGSNDAAANGTNLITDHVGEDDFVDMASSLMTKMKIKAARDQMSRAVASTFKLTPASRPCTCASVTLERQPLFIGGRYCKYSRALPQSPWIGTGDDETATMYGGGSAALVQNAATPENVTTMADDTETANVGTTIHQSIAMDGTAIAWSIDRAMPANTKDDTATIPATAMDGTATGGSVATAGDDTSTSANGTGTVSATAKDGTDCEPKPAAVDDTAMPATDATPANVEDGTTATAKDGIVPKPTTVARFNTLPTAARHLPPQSSISEKIAGAMVRHFGADGSRFIAAGREDIDVRMLGDGRPFAVQLLNARKTACLRTRASAAEALTALAAQINASEQRTRDISVHTLAHVSAKQVQQLNVGQEEKRKTYSALCCTRTPLMDDAPLRALHAHAFPLRVAQRTVVRVLKRRPLIDRTRFVYAMRAFVLDPHHFVLRLETQAGTYVKEFVHSDFGRTRPSVGQLMGLPLGQVDIVRLDVLSVDMTWPPPTEEQQKKKKMDDAQKEEEEEKEKNKMEGEEGKQPNG